jgi:ABC-type nitrate/sulfonate/bicarbonate transport system substrate-binding protein
MFRISAAALRRLALGVFALCCLSAVVGLRAAEPELLRVNLFPTAKQLPFLIGIERGIFARRGIRLDLQYTENSTTQRTALANGTVDIVHSAVDNAVAMVELAGNDVVIVMGGDSGSNEFIVQSHVNGFADVKGRILVVDATNTAFALQAKKILLGYGLQDGRDYTIKAIGRGAQRLQAMVDDKTNAAAIMNPPFSVQAVQMGMKSLGRTVDLLGPYQSAGVFVMRKWGREHGPLLERYLASYVESLRAVFDPASRADCVRLLMAQLKLSRDEAEATYGLLLDPKIGYVRDAKLDPEGFRATLALRAEIENKGAAVPAPEKYLDLSYYQRALATLPR